MRSYLVADIGGTHARCARAQIDQNRSAIALQDTRLYACREFASIDEMLTRYRNETGAELPAEGCIAVAGPVNGDRITFTNNDWNFSASQLRRRFGFARLSVINDLEAIAYACEQAPQDDLLTVRAGRSRRGAARVAISPGTGLGIAGFLSVDGRALTLPSEAGHTAFAPVNARQREILDAVRGDTQFVSWESVVSGPGLATLYRAVCALAGAAPRDLQPEEITRLARGGEDPMCAQAVDDFIDILANFASHCALTFCALGGVFLAGNICRGIHNGLSRERFAAAFRAQGAMTGFLADLPIYLLSLEYPGLAGAAWHAMQVGSASGAAARSTTPAGAGG